MALKLYDYPLSGHAHRLRLFLSLLGLEYERVTVDMAKGEHKAPEYLKLNPLGQVPTLVDGEVVVTDSTAGLVYLAKKYGGEQWLPGDPAGAARVQRWLSSASGELWRGPSTARAIAAVGARRLRVVKRLIGALGPGAAPPEILDGLMQRPPFAFPYFGSGARTRMEAMNKDLADAGIDAGVYNLDLTRNMNGPRYHPCILLPCHQDVTDTQVAEMAEILAADRT